jgi:hypothetical protein
MTHLRILIADDHPLVRSGMRALLSATEDMEVIGEAAKGEEAIAKLYDSYSFARSARRCFCTFPSALRGSSSTKTTRRGFL